MDLKEKKSDVFLVTTALEKSWPEGNPVRFLGEWCRLYSRKKKWQSLDGDLLPFHWDDREKLNLDFDYLQEFNEELLDDLVMILNEIHNTEHNSKYWRILIGYWINTFTSVLYDRWYSIREATNQGGLSTIVFPSDLKSLAANDTAHFLELAGSNDYWNHLLYLFCLPDNKKLKRVENNDSECIAVFKNSVSRPAQTLLEKVKQFISKGLWLLKKKNNVVIFNSYLSLRDKVVLNATFGQLPSLVDFLGKVRDIEYSSHFREWRLADRVGQDDFKKFARQMAPKLMPRIFLEGYQISKKDSEAVNLPKSPKVVFTAVSHYADDIFKLWAANVVSNGSKLLIGQHGGGCPDKFNASLEYEISVADIFMSPGWSDKNNKCIRPVGNFRTPYKATEQSTNPKGGVLICCGTMPQYAFDLRSMALGPQTIRNYEHAFALVDLLSESQKTKLRVRCHPSDEGWDSKARWLARHPNIKFADTRKSIHDSMRSFSLIIATYRATVYVDSLTADIPTIMYWDPDFWEVIDAAKSVFTKLSDVGIFHTSPESVSQHLAEHSGKISEWWNSADVQEARLEFLLAYSTSHLNALENIRTEIKHAFKKP